MNPELKQQHSADAELRKLIEDAAKLLGYDQCYDPADGYYSKNRWGLFHFNPCDQERGDLMKVADAAGLSIDFELNEVVMPYFGGYKTFDFTKGDYQSLALAVLRTASAVWKARGER